MKRPAGFSFFKTGLFFAFFSVSLSLSAQTGLIHSAVDPLYPPLSFTNAVGEADGFCVELLRVSLKGVPLDLDTRSQDPAEYWQSLAAGELDVLPLVGRTPEKEDDFEFSIPFLSLKWAAFVRSEATSGEGLDTWSVAVVKGDPIERYLRATETAGKLIVADSPVGAFEMLTGGQVDAVMIQHLVGQSVIAQSRLNGIRLAEPLPDECEQPVCFAVKKGNGDLLVRLNDGIARSYLDGTYDRIHARWIQRDIRRELKGKMIVVGGDYNFPPYEFLDKDGLPSGYNVELTRAIARVMGLNVQIVLGPWAEIRKKLESGEVDAVQGMYYSPERDGQFDFSVPHQVVSHTAFMRSGTVYNGLDSLNNRRIAVMRGDIMHDFALHQGIGRPLVVTETEEAALRMLAEQKVDFALGSQLSGNFRIDKNKWKNLYGSSDQELERSDYCYAVRNGNDVLLAQFNEGMALLKLNGEYRRIRDRWLGVSEPSVRRVLYSRYVQLAVGVVLLVFLVFIAWVQTLKKQVSRKTTELFESEQQYSYLFENMPEGVALFEVVCDAQGEAADYRYLEVNSAFSVMMKVKSDELIGATVNSLPGKMEIDWNACKRVAKSGKSKMFQCHFKSIGKHFQVRVFRPRQGQIAALFEDITDRKKMENEIAQMARFPAQSPSPVLRISVDGTLLYANNASRQFLKYLKQMNGKILPGNFNSSFADMMASAKTYQQEMICGDVTYMLTISPQPAENDLDVYALDVTQKRRAEEHVKKTLSMLEATIESTADGILVADRKGKILCFNQKFIKMWHIPSGVMEQGDEKGAQDVLLNQLCEPEKFSAKVKELYGRPEDTSFDVLNFRDGRVFERYSQPQWINGKAVGRVWCFRDITEQRETMRKLNETLDHLRSSNRDLEQFAYVASHDLQEPLRMVANYLQLIERRYKNKLDQDGLEFIDFAVDGAVRMQQLIDSLLDYSRLQTRKRPFEIVQLDQIVQRTLRDLEDRLVETKAEVIVDPLPQVLIDPVQIGLVFQNLIGNALKFCDKKQPKIHVYAQDLSEYWKISVSDNGIGIEAEHYERIFKIFQRLNNRTDYPGTGIGLAICRRVLERHGGEIGVESVVGQGSTFWFTLYKKREG